MWTLIYKKQYGLHQPGDIHMIGRGLLDPKNYNWDLVELIEIPSQDVSRLLNEHGEWTGTINDLVQYSPSQQCGLMDRETAQKINVLLHKFTPTDEQLGILRDQLVQIINILGLEPTADFARLNTVAIEAIEATRAKKEALNA